MPAGITFNIFGNSSHTLDALMRPSQDVVEALETTISVLRIQRKEVQEAASTNAGDETAIELLKDLDFQLGIALVSHTNPAFVDEGVHRLEQLVFGYWAHHAAKCNSDASYKAKCEANPSAAHSVLAYYLFYLGVGRCKKEELDKAHAVVSKMLSLHPHPQGEELLKYVESKQADETATTGIFAVAGAALAAGAAIALASFARR